MSKQCIEGLLMASWNANQYFIRLQKMQKTSLHATKMLKKVKIKVVSYYNEIFYALIYTAHLGGF